MDDYFDKHILIVSNNVLSEQKNNGKTILSFIDTIDKKSIRQLYFHSDAPSVFGYSYFQITDKDVLKGKMCSSKRGRLVDIENASPRADIKVKRNIFTLFVRELVWWRSWKSPQLLKWLDEFQPDTVFFVAGDSCFAYPIVEFIKSRFSARLITYITDDYIMIRNKENLLERMRRELIRKKMIRCIENSDCYYTISHAMSEEYKTITGRTSQLLVNLTPSLYDENERVNEKGKTVFVYAGSLYYGRDKVLANVTEVIDRYNQEKNDASPTAVVRIYTNSVLDDSITALFKKYDCCQWYDSVSIDQLKKIYNHADVLLFVESFEPKIIEKTKYSLSTKVPEYLSLKKPILAIGPKGIGSMDYLSDCAVCVNDVSDLPILIKRVILQDPDLVDIAKKAETKYNTFHNKEILQQAFIKTLMK